MAPVSKFGLSLHWYDHCCNLTVDAAKNTIRQVSVAGVKASYSKVELKLTFCR